MWLSNAATGGFTSVNTGTNTCGYGLLNGDFNGDGKTDILWLSYGSGGVNLALWLSNGDGTFTVTTTNVPSNITASSCWTPKLADFNGDGRTDILWDQEHCNYRDQSSIARQLWLNNGDGTFTVVANLAGLDGQYTESNGYGWVMQIADLNGDGKADIFWNYELGFYRTSGGLRKAWLSNGDGTFKVIDNLGGLDGSYTTCGADPNTGIAYSWIPSVGATDFNGDGKADIFWNCVDDHFESQGARVLWISKGDGTFEVISNLAGQDGNYVSTGYGAFQGWVPHIADLNGDSKVDIFWDYVDPAGESLGTRKAWLSNGDGSFTILDNFGGLDGTFTSNYQASNNHVGWLPSLPTDFNGDGKSDIFWSYKANNIGIRSTALWTTDGIVPDLLSNITTGLGATTTVSYDTLSHGAPYSKDNTASYPVVDFMGPLSVVTRVDAPAMTAASPGAVYTTTYNYAGAKVDLSGRGFLGFRQITATDLQTNIVQTTSYRQDFPFVGSVASQTRSVGSVTIGQVTNTYLFANSSGAAAISAPSSANAPYVASLQSSTTTGSDLDGSVLPTVTTSYQYDRYGNPTQVVVSTSDGFSKTTTNTYTNDATNWFLGLLTGATVTSTTP
jgi:hypothetical protein